jgi:hypothetical protein
MEGQVVRIPAGDTQPAVPTSTPRQKPRGQGRLVKQGTVLAREMGWRRIRKTRVTAVMRCSDRQLYNYMDRRARVPGMQLGPLCDLLDMDPEELVDERNFLLEA